MESIESNYNMHCDFLHICMCMHIEEANNQLVKEELCNKEKTRTCWPGEDKKKIYVKTKLCQLKAVAAR